MRKLLNSRVTAVAAGATVLVGLGAGGATAAGMIGSQDIRNQSVRGIDIARGTVDTSELRDRGVNGQDIGLNTIGRPQLRPNSVGVNQISPFVMGRINSAGSQEDVRGLKERVSQLETQSESQEGSLATIGHLLFGTEAKTTTLTYELKDPVPLKELDLTFFQERLMGTGNYGASVVLGVDMDGDGKYESDDRAWGAATDAESKVAALGDDTFLAMDGGDPDKFKVKTSSVKRWWTPNSAGDGFENVDANCYSELITVIDDCSNKKLDGSAVNMVHVVRLTMGGTPAWTDEAVRVTVLDDRLSLTDEEAETP